MSKALIVVLSILAIVFAMTGCASRSDSQACVEEPGLGPTAFSSVVEDAMEEGNPESLMEGEPPRDVAAFVIPAPVQRKPLPAPDPNALTAFTSAFDGDPFRVHVLNIGAGTCTIIECPNSDDVVIFDCGQKSPSSSDMSESDVRDYYDSLGFDGRPIVVLSHADSDHVNLVSDLLGDRTAQSVWLGGRLGDYRGEIARWIDKQDDRQREINHGWPSGYSASGRRVRDLQCGDADGYILTVNTEAGTNPSSLMLLYQYQDFGVILSGDAEGETERRALRNHGDRLRGVTVVLSSHHGAKSHHSNHTTWIDAIDPAVVIYSSGTLYGHPKGDVVARYSGYVGAAESHDMWDDPGTDDEDFYSSDRAEYVTELNGRILIESDGSFFTIDCSRDSSC